ncbi:MAG: hypothetical protein HOL98_06720 [Gammaproteobacteria bacterium]|nr:hypothetical protein [Gammaproteobacteria bacterium]MBT5203130.1 hypothetical protein [Gammaproteobacteria bacterium]MBT5603263.1 hypothetical protein [Gammaproteobacteria bacterium]MBT6244751.1 hypothetical protein [Gammaproteobacteria bacterium]
MNVLIRLILVFTFSTVSVLTYASDTAELDAIKRDLAELVMRVAALEAENAALKASNPSQPALAPVLTGSNIAAVKPEVWTDRIKLQGDFRYRYESIDIQGSDDRERNRMRARIGMQAKMSDDLEVTIGLASGGIDPVSSNQTLRGAGSTKNFGLDLAYLQWTLNDLVTLRAGKFKNIWFKSEKSELIWDNDYNPEGLALSYQTDKTFLHGALNWLESDTKNDQTFLLGVQGGLIKQLSDTRLTAGLGYYQLAIAGREAIFRDEDYFGNSFDCSDGAGLTGCQYSFDYEQLQVFVQTEFSLSGLPVVAFAERVENLAVDTADIGWSAGFRLGKAKVPGSWQFGYQYLHLEADAVLGLTTGSDFAGGGTDGEGHILKGSWMLTENWSLALTLFANDQDMTASSREYRRVQVDTQVKF